MMKNSEVQTSVMPIVALRGLVVFPGAQMHFDVGRSKSISAAFLSYAKKRYDR